MKEREREEGGERDKRNKDKTKGDKKTKRHTSFYTFFKHNFSK